MKYCTNIKYDQSLIGRITICGLIAGYGVGTSYATEANIPRNNGTISKAIPVDDFLSSLGINIHHAQGVDIKSYVEPINYLGIRNVRDDLTKPQAYVYLNKQTGVKVDLIASAQSMEINIETFRYLAREGALLAIEGPNEPNNWPIKYKGKIGGGYSRILPASADWTPVAEFQKDLYTAAKSDHLLSEYPVFHVSEAGAQYPNVGLQFLKIPKLAQTTLPPGTNFADFANVHNYVSGTKSQHVTNQAWNASDPTLNSNWDGLYAEYGRLWGHGFQGYTSEELLNIPKVTTETGWDSKSQFGGEYLQGTILLNTYLSQFKRGWRYTFVYMLRDGEGGSGNQGVFNADSTPKLAATYIHNLTTILKNNNVKFSPLEINYELHDASEAIHDILLQTNKNEFALVIWGERVEGSEMVTVELSDAAKRITIFDPTVGENVVHDYGAAKTFTMPIKDHPIVVKIIK